MEHSFDIEIAQEYSLVAAILYRHMPFWIAKNKTNNSNYHDGRTWTYNSIQAFSDQFPYLGKGQIRKGLELLIERGILLRSNYNKRGADRTSWYAFADEKTAPKGLPANLLKLQMRNQAKKPIFENNKSIFENHKALPDQSNPDIPTQINQKVEKNPQEILDLDCKITEAKKFLREQLSRIFYSFQDER